MWVHILACVIAVATCQSFFHIRLFGDDAKSVSSSQTLSQSQGSAQPGEASLSKSSTPKQSSNSLAGATVTPKRARRERPTGSSSASSLSSPPQPGELSSLYLSANICTLSVHLCGAHHII